MAKIGTRSRVRQVPRANPNVQKNDYVVQVAGFIDLTWYEVGDPIRLTAKQAMYLELAGTVAAK